MFLVVIIIISMIDTSLENVVSTAQGRVQGIFKEGYISYYGIPYTSVSGAAGRFKDLFELFPILSYEHYVDGHMFFYHRGFIVPTNSPRGGLAPVWSDVRESHTAHCSSSSPVDECLKLDVNVPPGSGLPVLVWITGGVGHYDPTMMVERGIIVVIVRHRLGPIGFLCSSENNIPGNAGLKDVVMALRWIRDNIVAFNGNPHIVVVAGQSFGAAMVQSLMLSHMARGLFHGAIMQSGSVLAPWAFNFDAEERAKTLKMKFNATFPLAKATPMDLATKTDALELPYLPFGICVENALKNEERFFSDSPVELLSNGKVVSVPLLIGYVNNEAYVFTSMFKEVQVLNKMSKELNFLIPIELRMNKREIPQLAKKIKDMYFEGNMSMESVLEYHRDAYFLSHIHKSVHFQVNAKSPVYYYQFSHSGNVGVEDEPGVIKAGAAHSDELAYLFPYKGRKLDGDDGVVQEHLVKLWTNFVKHLNPTPSGEEFIWEPFNPYDNQILDISIDMEMMEFPFKKKMQMWDEIYDRFYYERLL